MVRFVSLFLFLAVFCLPAFADIKCDVCGKTVFPVEDMKFAEHHFHKNCFKCSKCGLSLKLNTAQISEGKLYCKDHMPKPVAANTAVNSVATSSSASAPQKASTGTGTAVKSSGPAVVPPAVTK